MTAGTSFGGIFAVIAAGPVSGASLLRDSFRSYAPGEVWTEGTAHGPWFVRVNNTLLTTFTDLETPYLSGSIGLYTEDADVRFDSVRVRG